MPLSSITLPAPPPIVPLDERAFLEPPPDDAAPIRLFVHFPVARGWPEVLGAYPTSSDRVELEHPGLRRIPNAFMFSPEMARELLAGRLREVSAISPGEFAGPPRYLLLLNGGWSVAEVDPRLIKTGDECAPPAAAFSWRPAEPDEDLFFGPEQYRARLRSRLDDPAPIDDEIALDPDRRFFMALELATNRALVQYPLQRPVNALLQPLVLRAHARIYNASAPAEPARIVPCHPPHVRAIADKFVELMPRELSESPSRLAIAAGRFAAGRLRRKVESVWITQPTSGYFLLFAEFAFAALDLTDQHGAPEAPPGGRPLWLALAAAFLAARRVHTDVYQADPGEDALRRYRACAFQPLRAQEWSDACIARNAGAFSAMDETSLRAAAGADMMATFPGFARRPPPRGPVV